MPPVPRNLRYESGDTIRSPRRRYRTKAMHNYCMPRSERSSASSENKQSQSNMPPAPRKFRYERSSSTLNTPTYWTKAYPSISWKPKTEASVPNKMRVHKLPIQTEDRCEDQQVNLPTQPSTAILTESVIQYAFQEECKESPSSVCELHIPSSSQTADKKPPKKLKNYFLTPLSISKRKLAMQSVLDKGVLDNVVCEVGIIVKDVLNGYEPNQLLNSITRNITRKLIKKEVYRKQDIERFIQHYFII